NVVRVPPTLGGHNPGESDATLAERRDACSLQRGNGANRFRDFGFLPPVHPLVGGEWRGCVVEPDDGGKRFRVGLHLFGHRFGNSTGGQSVAAFTRWYSGRMAASVCSLAPPAFAAAPSAASASRSSPARVSSANQSR